MFPFWSRIAASLLNPKVADSINEVASQPKALRNTLITLYASPESTAVPCLCLVGGRVPAEQS